MWCALRAGKGRGGEKPNRTNGDKLAGGELESSGSADDPPARALTNHRFHCSRNVREVRQGGWKGRRTG